MAAGGGQWTGIAREVQRCSDYLGHGSSLVVELPKVVARFIALTVPKWFGGNLCKIFKMIGGPMVKSGGKTQGRGGNFATQKPRPIFLARRTSGKNSHY
jgi:hypothetical protein